MQGQTIKLTSFWWDEYNQSHSMWFILLLCICNTFNGEELGGKANIDINCSSRVEMYCDNEEASIFTQS